MAEVLMSLSKMPSKFSMPEEVIARSRAEIPPLRRITRLTRQAAGRAVLAMRAAARQNRPTSAAAW